MKLKKIFIDETTVKIVSLLTAIILWMYVISVNNPEVDITIRNVPLVISNAESIHDSGLEVISVSDEKIDVKVSGRMNSVSKITSEDIRAQLDVSVINSADNHYVKPKVFVSVSGVDVVSTSVSNVSVFVDYIAKVEKEVVVETIGKPADGYKVVSAVATNNKVILTGPQSIVEKIEKVKAVIDVTGESKELNEHCELKTYSSANNEIISEEVKLSMTDVSVSVKIEFAKKVKIVPVVEKLHNFNIDDYRMEASAAEIEIYGNKNQVQNVSEIVAAIDNISTDDEDYLLNTSWDAELKLPEGVWTDDRLKKISVKFHKK